MGLCKLNLSFLTNCYFLQAIIKLNNAKKEI